MVALRGVVVYHIQDHLDAGLVVGAHHLFELGHGIARGRGGGVAVLRGEETERVVAPVVAQPEFE